MGRTESWGEVLLGGSGHLKWLLCRWEEVWFPSCHSLMSFPLQVSNATKHDSVVAAVEWQRKLEAAEALLALRNSPLPPPVSASPKRRGKKPSSHRPGHGPQGEESWGVGELGSWRGCNLVIPGNFETELTRLRHLISSL